MISMGEINNNVAKLTQISANLDDALTEVEARHSEGLKLVCLETHTLVLSI